MPEFIDGWSLVHGGVSAGASILGVPLWVGVIGHQLHELWENSTQGIKFWRETLGYTLYDGDTAQNSAADTLFFTLGYLGANKTFKNKKLF